jgi:hypothetical protein
VTNTFGIDSKTLNPAILGQATVQRQVNLGLRFNGQKAATRKENSSCGLGIGRQRKSCSVGCTSPILENAAKVLPI